MHSKGQSELIQYILVILFSMIVLVSIVALSFSFYNNAIRSGVEQDLKQISIQVSDYIVKLYDISKNSEVAPAVNTSVLINEADLNLPDQVGRRNYEILLSTATSLFVQIQNVSISNQNFTPITSNSGAKIIARTTQDPIVEVEFPIPNIDIAVQGKSIGQNTELRYYRYNYNGNQYDRIVLGPADVFIDITKVS